jgi:hypothetical protein
LTNESAIGIAAIVFVLFGSALALLAVGDHIRCVDAAREAARLAARGDVRHARSSAAQISPRGAQIAIDDRSGVIVVTVTFRAPFLGSLDVGASAAAAPEPVAGP